MRPDVAQVADLVGDGGIPRSVQNQGTDHIWVCTREVNGSQKNY